MSKDIEHIYNILCVDDNKNNLFTLSALLATLESVNSIEAISAKEALNILLSHSIDLILCDIQMPDINGFELAKMIKSNKKTKHIPIIFVTAVFKSDEFIAQGFEIGAIDYITKPIDDNQLISKITLYLKIFEEKKKLLQSEKRFYDIAQSIGDGIYTLDINSKTTFINKEALELLQFKTHELMGKKIHDYIHYKDGNNREILSNECKIHSSMFNGEEYRSENEFLVKKDGTLLPVSIVSTPLYMKNEIVGTVTIFRDKTKQKRIEHLEEEKSKNQEQIIHSMIDMIESRDSYTAGHTKRVADYSVLIAKEMNYKTEDIELLKKAAWLHDIGKISTPDSVLLKPGQLDDTEFILIKDHLTAGYEMLKQIDQYSDIANIMREHHEKYNGTGYPRGLKGEEILPLSRIMMVADAFDAMTTNRVYKPRKTIEVALAELEDLSARHFHPEVVSAAVVALKNISLNEDINQLPQTSIERQRFAYFYKDRLTNLFIVDYLSLILRYHINSKSVYMYNIELHHFSEYNTQNGWNEGDKFLVKFAKFLDKLYEDTVVFRVEGDDFMILSEVKLETIISKIEDFELLKESIVGCSIEEKYIENINKLIVT